MKLTQTDADNVLITAPKARENELGGISDMTLWRWLNDPALEFPRPIYINKRRYFRLGEIRGFKARQQRKAA